MGEEGFSSDSSPALPRQHPLGGRRRATLGAARPDLMPNHPLAPRHFSTHALFPRTARPAVDAVTGRRLLLGNGDVRLAYVVADCAEPVIPQRDRRRVPLRRGRARPPWRRVFGDLEVGEGDYVIIPRATTYRVVPTGGAPVRLYAIEANSHIGPPKRFLSRFGQLLEHAPYCERDLRGPSAPSGRPVDPGHGRRGPHQAPRTRGRRDRRDGPRYPHHPFDVVGWDGCLYPYAFNIADYEPITGRVHQPPPAHQVFEGHNFVICNFVPRKVDYHPLVDPGAVLPLQRRLRRGDVLLRRRLRGPQGIRHRAGLDQPAPRRPPARSAARRVRAVASARSSSTSSRSWSTPSARSTWVRARWATDDGVYAYSWSGGRRLGRRDVTTAAMRAVRGVLSTTPRSSRPATLPLVEAVPGARRAPRAGARGARRAVRRGGGGPAGARAPSSSTAAAVLRGVGDRAGAGGRAHVSRDGGPRPSPRRPRGRGGRSHGRGRDGERRADPRPGPAGRPRPHGRRPPRDGVRRAAPRRAAPRPARRRWPARHTSPSCAPAASAPTSTRTSASSAAAVVACVRGGRAVQGHGRACTTRCATPTPQRGSSSTASSTCWSPSPRRCEGADAAEASVTPGRA